MNLTPTFELREELRRLIDERVLPGMSPSDTRFSDTEVDTMLATSSHIYAAASSGWMIKASRAMSERGGLEKSSAGDEKHEFISLEAYRNHCNLMSAHYAAKVPSAGSRVMGYDFGDCST